MRKNFKFPGSIDYFMGGSLNFVLWCMYVAMIEMDDWKFMNDWFDLVSSDFDGFGIADVDWAMSNGDESVAMLRVVIDDTHVVGGDRVLSAKTLDHFRGTWIHRETLSGIHQTGQILSKSLEYTGYCEQWLLIRKILALEEMAEDFIIAKRTMLTLVFVRMISFPVFSLDKRIAAWVVN